MISSAELSLALTYLLNPSIVQLRSGPKNHLRLTIGSSSNRHRNQQPRSPMIAYAALLNRFKTRANALAPRYTGNKAILQAPARKA